MARLLSLAVVCMTLCASVLAGPRAMRELEDPTPTESQAMCELQNNLKEAGELPADMDKTRNISSASGYLMTEYTGLRRDHPNTGSSGTNLVVTGAIAV